MKSIMFILGLVTFFSGCAPQYAIRNQYISPINQKSKVCLRECAYQKQACQQRCEEDYSDCLSYANERAKKIQVKIDRKYKDRYENYLAKQNDYNLERLNWQNRYDERYRDWRYFNKKCSKHNDKYACRREYDVRHIIERLRRNRPIEPIEPRYITFDENLANQQKSCSENCGCNDSYNSCFVSCGGEIVPHKICIRNCD